MLTFCSVSLLPSQRGNAISVAGSVGCFSGLDQQPWLFIVVYYYYYEDRYPKQLFNREWHIKPRRGRQRKVWSRIVDDLFKSLDIDKGEWLEDIERGDSSSASFLACVEECISERESRRFEEGLNTKVKN